MFLKEKLDGSIKGRGVADGRKQREKIEPKDATSPTVSTEAVMLTAAIDALEGRDVAVVDIPGAYLSTDMDDELHVVFIGTLAEMMVLADLALYQPFVSYEKGKPVLYVRLQKALHGCLKSALLFYEKLMRDLEAYGFKINPYDPCLANKIIGRKQLKVCGHVEDLKISCFDANEVTKMIQWLESEYGEMHGSRGKRHDYLVMWLNYSITGGSAHIHGRIPDGSTRRFRRGDNRDTRNTCRIKPFQRQEI